MIRVTRGDCYWDFTIRVNQYSDAKLHVAGSGYPASSWLPPKIPQDVIDEAMRRISELVSSGVRAGERY